MAVDDGLRTRFIEQVIVAQEDERRRIARELHDGIGQALTSMLVRLRSLDTQLPSDGSAQHVVRELRETCGTTLDEIGRLARGLRPAVLDELGVQAAVQRQAADFESSHGITTDVGLVGFEPEERLPANTEITIYRIVQEALTNIAKHAEASSASVIVERRPGDIRVIVEDDGRGISPSAPSASTGGLGLQGIRERVALVKGSLTLESVPGSGTTLYVQIPLNTEVTEYFICRGAQSFRVPFGVSTIGRSPECEYVLDDARVSRRHARLDLDENGITIEDLGSANGVIVNGLRIDAPTRLAGGDAISLGGDLLSIDERVDEEPSSEKRRSTLPGQVTLRPPPNDSSEGSTSRIDAIEVAGRLAERLLARGRVEAAERLLRGRLAAVLDAANRGQLVQPGIAQNAARYALILSQQARSQRWADFSLELYNALGTLLPDRIVEWLEQASELPQRRLLDRQIALARARGSSAAVARLEALKERAPKERASE